MYIATSRLIVTCILTAIVIAYTCWTVVLVSFIRAKDEGRNLRKKVQLDYFKRVHHLVSDYIFYLLYIPMLLHSAVGTMDLFRLMEGQAMREDAVNMAVSVVLFSCYTPFAFLYHLVKVEFNPKFGNYLSRWRFSDTGFKLILLALLACVLERFPYETNPDIHLLALASVGAFQCLRFFFFVQFYAQAINFMEVSKGLLLFEIAVLWMLHEATHGDLYVPLWLVIVFPISSFSLFLTHRKYVSYWENNRFIAGAFTLQMRLRQLIRERSCITAEVDLKEFDRKCVQMFNDFQEIHATKESILIWYIHFFVETTVSVNHLLTIAH
jgi:hypothetical protein